MNARCAAGTGRFLAVVAQRLDVPIASLGEHARRADKPASISSMCVVFAESELIGLLASGTSRENIIAGVCRAIAQRIAAMAGRIPAGKIVFTGGVARGWHAGRSRGGAPAPRYRGVRPLHDRRDRRGDYRRAGKWRERVRIELNRDLLQPHIGFEDREAHQVPIHSHACLW